MVAGHREIRITRNSLRGCVKCDEIEGVSIQMMIASWPGTIVYSVYVGWSVATESPIHGRSESE